MVIQAADALNHLKNYGIMGEVFGLWQVRPLPDGLWEHLQGKRSIM